MGPPIPFIVGCGRSGTTLLRSMLDSHPELAIPGENDALHLELKRSTPFGRGEPISVEELDALVRRSPASARSLAEHTAAVPGPTATLSEWIDHAYRSYAAAHGKGRYGDKTGGLIFYMPELRDAVPDAVFIHLIRDGRNVAMAFVDQPTWGPSTIAHAARVWRDHVTVGRAVGLQLGHDRYLEVRYEDLVADPEGTLRPICAFLDLDFDPRMLDHSESARRAVDYSPEPASHGRLTRGVTSGLRDWRQEMSLKDRLSFELRGGPALEVCGYEPGLPQRVARSIGFRTRRLWKRARNG